MILKEKFKRYLDMLDRDEPIRLVYIGTPMAGLTYTKDTQKDLVVNSFKLTESIYSGFNTKAVTFVEHINGPLLYSWERLNDTFVRDKECDILSFYLYGRSLDIFSVEDNDIQLYGSNNENPLEFYF